MDEQQLIERAITGDQHCLNILFQMHYKSVYGYLIKLSGDVHLAEDLVQETLLKATLNIEKFRGDSKFLTYLNKLQRIFIVMKFESNIESFMMIK